MRPRMHRMVGPSRSVLVLLLGVGALSGCGFSCDPVKDFDKNDLEKAASYPEGWGGRRSLPVDTWTRNPDLEAFLRAALKTENVGTIATKYGMQCLPASQGSGCDDCFACRKTVREWRMGMATPPIPIYMEVFKCVDYGEVLVQAAIGPGQTVTAMTYWKTTPEARETLSRPKAPPPIEVPPLPLPPAVTVRRPWLPASRQSRPPNSPPRPAPRRCAGRAWPAGDRPSRRHAPSGSPSPRP